MRWVKPRVVIGGVTEVLSKMHSSDQAELWRGAFWAKESVSKGLEVGGSRQTGNREYSNGAGAQSVGIPRGGSPPFPGTSSPLRYLPAVSLNICSTVAVGVQICLPHPSGSSWRARTLSSSLLYPQSLAQGWPGTEMEPVNE